MTKTVLITPQCFVCGWRVLAHQCSPCPILQIVWEWARSSEKTQLGQLTQIDQCYTMWHHVQHWNRKTVFPKYLLLEDSLSIGLLVVNDCLCIDCFALFLHLLNCLYLNSQVFFLVFCCCCCYFCCCCCSLVCLFFLGFALPIFSLILGQGSEWHQPKDNLFIHIGGVAL